MKLLFINIFFWLCHIILAAHWKNKDLLVEFAPKQVYRFNGLGSSEVLHWTLDASNEMTILRFSGTVNQTGSGIPVDCADVNVTTIVRHNAIPLPNPRDSFIPDQTFTQTDGELYSGSFIISKTTDVFHEVVINRTNAGHYFTSVFLPYDLERINVAGLSKNCHYYVSLQVLSINSTTTTTTITNYIDTDSLKLIRQQFSLFNVNFMPVAFNHSLSVNKTAKIVWDVNPLSDSGGTLNIDITSFPVDVTMFEGNASVIGCLRNAFSQNNTNCLGDVLILNNSHHGVETKWHVPFPISGTWNLEISLQCRAASNVCNAFVQPIEVTVSIGGCVDNCHNDKRQGSCGIYRTDDLLFSACRCKVGWRGIACNDGRDAESYNTQLLHTLFLTLSNLMFLPCVALAIYRKFYTEALVYFFVAFMSSFYHACDQPGVVVYCLIPYETLQFSDFLSSISAIWFTLLAVVNLPYSFESWFHVAGCLAFAVAVSFDRFNVWTTVVPAVIGVIIVISKWSFKCHANKKCYPGARKTLVSILPGMICAGVGLILFAFVETSENYYIVHSLWHILMATAVLFLLPVGPKYKKNSSHKVEVANENLEPSRFNTYTEADTNSGTFTNTALV